MHTIYGKIIPADNQPINYFMMPRNNWNIVESSVKHHNPTPSFYKNEECANTIQMPPLPAYEYRGITPE